MHTRPLHLALVSCLLLALCIPVAFAAGGPPDTPNRGMYGANDSTISPGAPWRDVPDASPENDTQADQMTPSPTSSPPASAPTTAEASPDAQFSDARGSMAVAGNRFSTSRLGLAILAGALLAAVVLVSDLSRRLNLPSGYRHRYLVFAFFAAMAALIAVSLYLADLRDQGWTILLPAFTVSLVGSAAGISYGFFRGRWLPRTLWFHAGGAAALAVILPFVITSTAGGSDAAIPLGILLVVSAGAAFWLARSVPKVETPAAGMPTLVEAPDPDRLGIPTAFFQEYSEIVLVATGGLARVYRARRKADGRVVAIKLPLNTSETTGACFMREMMVWKDLDHPNIVQILNANVLPVPAVEMEYIERSLADLKKPVPVEEAVRLIRGIANGLAYAHQRGVIHRDIKPENILLMSDGTPKLTDWGMSRIASACNLPTVTGFSPAYAAPEQVAPSKYGGTDARTDIFQLGVVFYELVTGRLPFTGGGILEITSAILSTDPPRPSELAPESSIVEPVILRCLERDPANRYQSITDLLHDLDQAQSGM